MVLCDRCAGIDFGSLIERACIEAVGVPSKPNYIPPHPITKDFSFAVLRSAALQGCDLCSLIHRGLLDRTNTRPIRKDSKFEDLKLDSMLVMSIKLERCHEDLAPVEAQCSALKVQCYTSNTDLGKAWNGIWLTLASETNSQYVPAKRLAWNPSLWCSWMDNCITRHETCEATKQDGNPPTRLVDVGSIDTQPKLVVSCGKSVEYVALSHCWGGSLPLRTTTANFHDHLRAVCWDNLPATFQDAVKITCFMGYRYLWIDCLCIIQDSEEDWLRECALMGEIYAGASLTIAAEGSSSPSDESLEL